MTSVLVAVLDVVSLSRLTYSLVRDIYLLIHKTFFSPYLLIMNTRTSLLLTIKINNTSSLGYINSLVFCYNLVCGKLDNLFFTPDITQVHYIDYIMLMRPGEQEIAITPDLLVRHLHIRKWVLNITKM